MRETGEDGLYQIDVRSRECLPSLRLRPLSVPTQIRLRRLDGLVRLALKVGRGGKQRCASFPRRARDEVEHGRIDDGVQKLTTTA